jgi:PAS domain S-box-containing protein
MMVHARMNASPERDGKLLAAIEHSAETMEICALEYSVWDGKNRLRWIRQSMMPRKEADGGIVFSGVMRDVTREKEAEDQVELLRSVVVQSTDAIGIFESSFGPAHGTKILYLNEKFIHLFGGSADALVGQPIESLRSLDLHRRGRELISAAVKRNDSAPFDYEVLGADGHSFWVEVRITKVQGLERDGTRWVAISHDITERRHSLDELTRAKDAAEAGSRAKGAFLAAMSHELRSPLNAIIGFTEIIQAGVARAGWIPPYAEYLSDISESGRHLLHLINTILDLSRIESGQLVLNREPIDPGELLRAALAQSAASARDGDIAVTARIPLDCPRIEGDYLKLKQMLLNIVSNAIKFTPVGGKIDVSLNFTETEALIAVTDTGCGIPVGDLERVMLPFVQVGSTMSRKFEGSGLGLPIARSLCALHGGTLEIGSVEGQGTKVLISLPLLEAGAQELGASPEKPRPLADAAAA